MGDINADVMWYHGCGTLANLKQISKRLKKFTKGGFYIEADELTQDERTAYRNDLWHDKRNMRITEDVKPLLCTEEQLSKEKEIFYIKIYGPKVIRHKKIAVARDHMVLQISGDSCFYSSALTLNEANAIATRNTGTINLVVKIIETHNHPSNWGR